jgi:hypothetical protein
VTIVQSNGLAERVKWQPSLFADAEQLRLPNGVVPRQVETVINHRLVNRTQIVAGVSGGVMVAPGDVLRDAESDNDRALNQKVGAVPADVAAVWWWDAD